MICNHCGVLYQDHISLKRHITRGKCPKFNASLPPQAWIIRYQPAILEVFLLQQPEHWLQDRDFMARLRTECVLCGRKFDAGRALGLHLRQEHFPEMTRAQPYATHLQSNFQPHGAACLCGAWQTVTTASHQCPVASQLAVLRELAKEQLPPPPTGTLPRLLDRWLADEDIDKAWEHPEFSYVFGNYCSLCLHKISDLDALWRHFEEYHDSMLDHVIRRLDRILQDRDTCCIACRYLPLKDCTQAPKCPYAVNSLLLCHLRHGLGANGGARSRHPIGTPRRVRPLDWRSTAPFASSPSRNRWTEETTPTISEVRTPRRRRSGTMSTDVSPTPETGRYAERSEYGHELAAVHGQAAIGCGGACDGSHQTVASEPQERRTPPATESTDMCEHLPGDACENGETGPGQTGGPHLAVDHGGSQSPLSQVEPRDEVPTTTTSARNPSDGPDGCDHSDHGTLQTGRSGAKIQCHGQSQQANLPGHSMEIASELEKRELPDPTFGASTRECGLAVHHVHQQTLDTTALGFSSADRTKYAGGLPREAIQTAILALRLINPQNQCWGNASVCCWLWAMSMVKDLQWSDFGELQNEVAVLLSTNQAAGVDLLAMGFDPVNWQGQQQRDSSEYTLALLERAQPPFFKQSWSTRVMVGESPETLESVTGYGPLILRKNVQGSQHMQEIVDAWCTADNAITAFDTDSIGKTFQIDRVYHDNSGRPCTTSSMLKLGDLLLLPHFVFDTTYELIPYVVVAIVYHMGRTGAGHFQSGLRCGHQFWMKTDDGKTAAMHPGLPNSEAGGIAQVWVIRQDRQAFTDLMPQPWDFNQQVRLIRQKMLTGNEKDLWGLPHLQRLMRCYCIFCGQWIFRWEDHVRHMNEHHPDVPLPWLEYRAAVNALVHHPCRWCKAWNTEEHPCQVLWQAFLAKNMDPLTMRDVTLTMADLAEASAKRGAQDLPSDATKATKEIAPLPLEETLAALATPLHTMSCGANSFKTFLDNPASLFTSNSSSAGSNATSEAMGSDPPSDQEH